MLEQVAMPSSRDPPNLGIEPISPALAGRFFTTGKPFTHVSGVQKWVYRVREDRKRGADGDRQTNRHTHTPGQGNSSKCRERERRKGGKKGQRKGQKEKQKDGEERENMAEAYPFYEKLRGESLCPFLFIKIESLQRRRNIMSLPLHAKSKKIWYKWTYSWNRDSQIQRTNIWLPVGKKRRKG